MKMQGKYNVKFLSLNGMDVYAVEERNELWNSFAMYSNFEDFAKHMNEIITNPDIDFKVDESIEIDRWYFVLNDGLAFMSRLDNHQLYARLI